MGTLQPSKSATQKPFKHRRTGGEVHRCKKGHRSEIKVEDWAKYGYANKQESFDQAPQYDGRQTLQIPRIHRKDFTVESFFEQFLKPHRPCIIEGAIDHWRGMTAWDPKALEKEYKHCEFKVGEDDKGRKLRMKYKYFLDYLDNQVDDSPLYLFETRVDNDPQMRKLLDDFEVPDVFPHDLFNVVNPGAKPPYRWWSIGPRRSGTTMHTDPLGTGAWNAVTHGRKRWALMEPHVPGKFAKGKDCIDKAAGEDDEAVMYFDYILPRIKKKHPEIRVFECIQGRGDVIYVPGDWWHGVVNLDDTVAVTQNYCGLDNFDRVWSRTRKERKKLAWLWLRGMKKFYPQLHARALDLNTRDHYVMRHERKGDEPSSSSDSSSSESSSDSSSDSEGDLLEGLPGVRTNAKIPLPWQESVRPTPPSSPPPGSIMPSSGTKRPRGTEGGASYPPTPTGAVPILQMYNKDGSCPQPPPEPAPGVTQ